MSQSGERQADFQAGVPRGVVRVDLSVDQPAELPPDMLERLRGLRRRAALQILQELGTDESVLSHTEHEQHAEHEQFALAIE
jgi:hypothetical protein